VRLARFRTADGEGWGFIDRDDVHIAATTVPLVDALTDRAFLDRARAEAGAGIALANVELLAPIASPPQFIGVGMNYAAHAAEAGFDTPPVPITFPFYATSVIGPHAAIEIPHTSDQIDWEAELAIVIGRGGRDIAIEDAMDHVAGYTIVNDVSARDIQASDGQWSRAKSFDTFKPMGPWITTPDELGTANNLDISLTVNGVVKQSSNTSDLIFTIPELVSHISQATTLRPGAVIATGTPEGLGLFRDPPEFLRNGDTVTVEIEGIGTLTNPVR
jgi:2-keto-4-pentenoate hydratase/2-oxohepta-3-ene-1,7-dioic acid hydratase in catechol pathway